jgi:hypothetical protein
LKTLLTFGLYVRPWAKIDYPDVPPAVGRFESDFFDPEEWKPEYPLPAFDRMRPEDAFWAARIVARFDEAAVRAIVEKGRYTDPVAAGYIVRTLMVRRNSVLRTWLNAVMPIVDPTLGPSGFTFRNAAVDAGVAAEPTTYEMAWYAFDNATGAHRKFGGTISGTVGGVARTPTVTLPSELANEPFVMVAVWANGGHANWRKPARVYFRKQGSGWQLVGLERDHTELPSS